MCGLTLVPTPLYRTVDDTKCQRRGPDATTVKHLPDIGYTAVHHTLFVTGTPTPQPLVADDAVLLFNGEIYNYKDLDPTATSDGAGILAAFRKHGVTFAQHLDGEFAVVLIDLKKNRLIVATDAFGTKPLFMASTSCGGRMCVASYASSFPRGTSPQRCMPNTITAHNLATGDTEVVTRTHQFDLRQHKGTYDGWIAAFRRAVAKRSRGHHVYVGMSSGYDSGAICAVLNTISAPYSTFTSTFNETRSIIDQRIAVNRDSDAFFIDESKETVSRNWTHLEKYAESLRTSKSNTLLAIAEIHRHAQTLGLFVCLSGQGADEIISDYAVNGVAQFGSNSKFEGIFPDDLHELLPTQDPRQTVQWSSFYHGTQHKYLMKEEHIGGAYGIETRYPFLDVEVVQEYLWLTAELKNKAYKAPIKALFDRAGYPYEANVKFGFNYISKAPLIAKVGL